MRVPDRVVILNDRSVVRGGAAYLAITLAKGTRDRGLPVTFIVGDDGRSDLGHGVDVVALGGVPLIDGPQSVGLWGLYDHTVRRRVGTWIARNDTPGTVYHLHNWAGILSPAIFDALIGVANRCVVHAHDFFLACPNGAFLDYSRVAVCHRTPLSLACLATQCDKRAYSHKLWRAARQGILLGRLQPFLEAARFVMIHEAMRPWLNRAIRPRHLIAIGNPVESFGPAVADPEANRRIAYVGQLQRYKGVFDLAEAGRRLDIRVDFFGSGESMDELKASYPEHTYHGWTSREEIGRALRSVRAAVVATQSPEAFCLAAFESVATGVPLIVSDTILAASELVASGAALPFRAGDVASLAEVIARVMRDDALTARLGRAARSRGTQIASSQSDWLSAHYHLYCSLVTEGPLRDEDRPVQLQVLR